jgi:hypothetical protein
MKHKTRIYILFFVTSAWVFIAPDHALATQAHGAPEGIYAHQLAHIFFIISMGFLIHWLRERKLVKESGWRFIQYAAFFFILWNMDAFAVHLFDDQFGIIQIKRIGSYHVQINALNGNRSIEILYYIAKLDHLLCVPALIFLYVGLRRLLRENHSSDTSPKVLRNNQP